MRRIDNSWKSKIKRRVDWMVKNKINYFQPTISPAPKNHDTNEIESLSKALEYYKPYCDKVIIAPKYMGSYAQLFLSKNIEESYFISRNGYKINHVEGLNELIPLLAENLIIQDLFSYKNRDWTLLEGELMPWKAMGEKLIEKEFVSYYELHKDFCKELSSNELAEMQNIIETMKEQKPWLRENLKPHEERQYNALKAVNPYNTVSYEKSVSMYKSQLDIFAADGKLEYIPFGELKYCENGVEVINYDSFCPYSYNQEISVHDLEKATALLDRVSKKGGEGIVVKPFHKNMVGIAPYLKVRTNDYLQLIYGIDFHENFNKYFERRKITNKLRTSIEQYEIACQLLRIPRTELKSSNKQYIKLLYEAIEQEEILQTLDKSL